MEQNGLIHHSMTLAESQQLQALEAVIDQGLRTFVDVGNALLEIRDSRLYRFAYDTFEEYCWKRWGMHRRYAYQLIDAVQVVENVRNCAHLLPTTESQARPLTILEPAQQREAWQRAVETAPNGKVTAAHVQTVVDEYRRPEPTPAPEPTPEIEESVFDAASNAVNVEDANGHVETFAPAPPHVSFNSGNNEWYTPADYIEAARRVMGCIDLDPASSDIANQTVQATTYYTAQDDGLSQDWEGNTWMNPPYSSELIGKFCAKLMWHVEQSDIPEAIVLVNNATETAWFGDLVCVASAVVFPRGRVRFWKPDGETGAPLQGQAILYIGHRPDRFLAEFSLIGWGAEVK